MSHRTLVADGLPDLDQRLSDELDVVNAAANAGLPAAGELTVRVLDDDGDLAAGLSGWTWGVAAGIAGLVVFAPKAWDVWLNPWVGSRSDRTESRWGPRRPWMLAGGLTPENVGDALNMLSPDAVDVSSGVESAPGVKDAGKITAFVDRVRAKEQTC